MIAEKVVEIYTDGGCDPNPGTGGWGAVLVYSTTQKELSGGAPESTNNRMEMTAAIEALRSLKRPCKVRLYTDSQYLKKGITEWMRNWKKNGWRTKAGPVKNKDLWETLDQLVNEHTVDWQWLRGHSGHYFNERCDELASDAIRAQRVRQGSRG